MEINSNFLSDIEEDYINLLYQADNITLKPVGYCMKK